MKQNVKRLALLCAAVSLILQYAAGQTGKANAAAAPAPATRATLFTNAVVAKGKGVNITRNELDEEVIRVKSQFAAQGRTAMPPDADAQVLDSLIRKQLILNQATDADRAKATTQYETFIANLKTQNKLSDDEFNQKLAAQLRLLNMTKEQWVKQNIDQATIPLVLERELKADVTDADARKFYDEHSATFEHPEMVRVAHVLVGTRDQLTGTEISDEQKAAKKKLADDIAKRAKAGEDFAKLVKQYSDDPGSKDKGGEYTFARAVADPYHAMVPAFEEAAFGLNTNQVSDPVATQYGYHIIKLYEKIPAKKEPYAGLDTKTTIPKADGTNATVKEVLSAEALNKQIPDYLKKLRKAAGVEILDDKLKVVEVPDLPDVPIATNSPAKPNK
jgi:peptidyl-prolyl cis-trans isomerase C